MREFPLQMNQTTAAKYCDVSVNTFKRLYRPYLNARQEGRRLYFLRTDIERLLHQRFSQTIHQPTENPTPPSKPPKPLSFEEALKKKHAQIN
jgi:hypothetical protein